MPAFLLKFLPKLKIISAIAGVAVLGWVVKQVYDAGYNAAVLESQENIIEAQEQAVEAARREWQASIDAERRQIETEEKIVERIRYVEREVPVVVDRIVTEQPECADLGPDFLRVFNHSIKAGGDSPAEPAAAAGGAYDPVPGA